MSTTITTPRTSAELFELIQNNGIQMHSDPGHGWLQVSLSLVANLGLKPSRYSYRDAYYAYLEEDCDMSKFFIALGILDDNEAMRTFWAQCSDNNTDYDSHIRRKDRFPG